MPLALKRISKGITFSQEGLDEIILFHKKVIENFDTAISAFASNDRVLADQVLRNKEELGMMERELVQAHLDRLRKGFRESIETSHIHLDLIGNLARINSLITHIIYPIVDEKRNRVREDVGIEGIRDANADCGMNHGSEDQNVCTGLDRMTSAIRNLTGV